MHALRADPKHAGGPTAATRCAISGISESTRSVQQNVRGRVKNEGMDESSGPEFLLARPGVERLYFPLDRISVGGERGFVEIAFGARLQVEIAVVVDAPHERGGSRIFSRRTSGM